MYSPVTIINSNRPECNKKFGICRKKLTLSFTPPPDDVDPITWLSKGIDHIVSYIQEDSLPGDKVGFTFSSPHFQEGKVHVAFMPAHNISAEKLLHIVGGLMQSNRNDGASWSGMFETEVTRIRLPNNAYYNPFTDPELYFKPSSGDASVDRSSISPNDYEAFKTYCNDKRKIVWIDNSENMSLPKAIVVGKARLKKDPEYELIRKNRKNRQSLKANKMLKKMKITIPKGGAGLSELNMFINHLKKYNLKVYQYNPNGNEIVFEGTNRGAEFTIKLIRCNGHYNLITK